MNKKTLETFKASKYYNYLSNSMTRGALLWAPLYAVASSALTYFLIADDSASAISFKEILMRNLLIIAPYMVLAETVCLEIRERLDATDSVRRRRRVRMSKLPRMFSSRRRNSGNSFRPKHA